MAPQLASGQRPADMSAPLIGAACHDGSRQGSADTSEVSFFEPAALTSEADFSRGELRSKVSRTVLPITADTVPSYHPKRASPAESSAFPTAIGASPPQLHPPRSDARFRLSPLGTCVLSGSSYDRVGLKPHHEPSDVSMTTLKHSIPADISALID
jgi:hypothetical protein